MSGGGLLLESGDATGGAVGGVTGGVAGNVAGGATGVSFLAGTTGFATAFAAGAADGVTASRSKRKSSVIWTGGTLPPFSDDGVDGCWFRFLDRLMVQLAKRRKGVG